MIKYYDRKTQTYQTEKVAGEKMIRWTYTSPVGMRLLEAVVKKKMCSSFYGWYLDQRISRRKIHPFVHKFDLDLSIAEKNVKEFSSFNDFFYRKLKPSARSIDPHKDSLISLGDGKLLAYEHINLDRLVQVKGITYSLQELIKSPEVALKYNRGTCLILRLCPTDYHRFHFIDSGICEPSHRIKGAYYSVNPVALQKVEKLFCENKREWSIFHSDHFGDILTIEVGATFVGSIIQTYPPHQKVARGDEKGYFKFGGSTVLLFFEENKVRIDPEIIEQTKLGYETYVLFGEKVGVRGGSFSG
ncbi:phosphatidylserine decarboxylase precursor [Desulfitobacterium dehalogenans ATCC 51507]|uniref:Phosphatidylserine decarboxylase proenzyme n=1 Tax=Desulfitobacterium dehalogenans (strain ATCC 51507 / DSM 9161 / JW/IU-DC1) TaxID=756499 RepID=I4ABE0_DESDJ|nr:phosphatidylserine decarboxylase [Desulfitobacterium dehalogenans]AFM01275.1 phosphatidylserine decarboxylase precursor [Desulfitobacterium dehalogenans ATCC 51507]